MTKMIEGEIYDFGQPGATEESRPIGISRSDAGSKGGDLNEPTTAIQLTRPIGYAECRYCKQPGWLGRSIQHTEACIMAKVWPRAKKLRGRRG